MANVHTRAWKDVGYEIAELLEERGADVNPVLWRFSPRQLAAYAFFAKQRRVAAARLDLATTAIGAQGSAKAIEDELKEMERDL